MIKKKIYRAKQIPGYFLYKIDKIHQILAKQTEIDRGMRVEEGKEQRGKKRKKERREGGD